MYSMCARRVRVGSLQAYQETGATHPPSLVSRYAPIKRVERHTLPLSCLGMHCGSEGTSAAASTYPTTPR